MSLKVSKRRLGVGCVSIIMMITFLLWNQTLLTTNNFQQYSKLVTPFILIMFFTQLVLLKFLLPRRRLLMYLVVTLFYIFHLSHVILNSFGYDFGSNERNNILFRFSGGICIEATNLILKACCGFFIGITIYFIFCNHTGRFETKMNYYGIERKNDFLSNKFLCILCIVIGFLADIFFSITAIIAQRTYGYEAVGESTAAISYAVRLASYLLLTGVLLIIQDESASLRKKRIVVLLFCTYKFVIMSSGLRAYSLINIIITLFAYFKMTSSSTKIKLKHMILGLISIQLVGGIIVGIRETRAMGIDFKIIASYMFDVKSNILFNMMGEFGITQNVICAILAATKGVAAGGTQLISSFILMIPFASKLFPRYDFNSAMLESKLNIHNYGGSYIGDVLFDFGSSMIIPSCIILGIIFAVLFEWFEYNLETRNIEKTAIMAPIIVEFVYCVRSSMAKMPRMIAWYVILVSLLVLFANIKKYRRRNV